jgi:hypothetical protein
MYIDRAGDRFGITLFHHGRAKSAKRVFALDPGHQRRFAAKTWMPGGADKSTRSAQGRLLWPGMTNFKYVGRI